jgi:hypothetical protein
MMGFATVAAGVLTITGHGYEMILEQGDAWTIEEATFDGAQLLDDTGSHGGVIYEDGNWIGAGHGGEVVVSSQLIVDGVSLDLSNGLEAYGHRFTVRTVSWVGPYFRLATVELGPEGIRETTSYLVHGDTSEVTKIYPMMHVLGSGFGDWFAMVDDVEEDGTFDGGNDTEFSGDLEYVLAYDDTDAIGIVYQQTGVNSFCLDRPTDRKLYMYPSVPTTAGDVVSYTATLRAFTATASEWETVARWLLGGGS